MLSWAYLKGKFVTSILLSNTFFEISNSLAQVFLKWAILKFRDLVESNICVEFCLETPPPLPSPLSPNLQEI